MNFFFYEVKLLFFVCSSIVNYILQSDPKYHLATITVIIDSFISADKKMPKMTFIKNTRRSFREFGKF